MTEASILAIVVLRGPARLHTVRDEAEAVLAQCEKKIKNRSV